jgi:hypothetical protein
VVIGPALSIPVIGSILKLAESWLINQLLGIVFAQCDGLVAVEQLVEMGRDLVDMTNGGNPHTVVTTHPGTDSAAGCGPNSEYQVTWSIMSV